MLEEKLKMRGGGMGSLSRVSLQPRSGVSFPPPPPCPALFELLALGQVTKQDSITGR